MLAVRDPLANAFIPKDRSVAAALWGVSRDDLKPQTVGRGSDAGQDAQTLFACFENRLIGEEEFAVRIRSIVVHSQSGSGNVVGVHDIGRLVLLVRKAAFA